MPKPELKGTPEVAATFQGFDGIKVHQPYKAGMAVDEELANVLNQTWTENLRNNTRKQIEEAAKAKGWDGEGKFSEWDGHGSKLTTADVQKLVTDYESTYEFGATGGPIGDPVQRIAIGLAKDRLEKSLRKQGVKLKDLDKAQRAELRAKAKEAVEKNPKFMEVARKRYERQLQDQRELEGL